MKYKKSNFYHSKINHNQAVIKNMLFQFQIDNLGIDDLRLILRKLEQVKNIMKTVVGYKYFSAEEVCKIIAEKYTELGDKEISYRHYTLSRTWKSYTLNILIPHNDPMKIKVKFKGLHPNDYFREDILKIKNYYLKGIKNLLQEKIDEKAK